MDDKDKQVLFSDMVGFYNIKTNLETEISILWINGDLIGAYNRIKMLYRHVLAHLRNKKSVEGIEEKFKEIEKYLFDPANEKMTTMAKFRKLSNTKKADPIMDLAFKDLKRAIVENNLELHYGVPMDILNRNKRDANLGKVFGRKL